MLLSKQTPIRIPKVIKNGDIRPSNLVTRVTGAITLKSLMFAVRACLAEPCLESTFHEKEKNLAMIS